MQTFSTRFAPSTKGAVVSIFKSSTKILINNVKRQKYEIEKNKFNTGYGVAKKMCKIGEIVLFATL